MNFFIVAISCSLVRIATSDDVTTQSSRFNDFDQSKDSKRVVLKGDCLVVCDASTDQQQRGSGGGGSPGGGYGGFGRQVAFSVQKTSSTSNDEKMLLSARQRRVVTFDGFLLNEGFCFDSSLAAFVPPVDGAYRIEFRVYRVYNNKILKVALTVDGTPVLYGVADGKSSKFEAATNSGIIKVKRGQQVRIEIMEGDVEGGWQYSTFSGHLLYYV